MKKILYLVTSCIMLVAFFTPLCKAASRVRVIPAEAFQNIDSLMVDVLSDSISNIIIRAEKINVSILKKDSTGNFVTQATKTCNKEQKGVIKFAMATSQCVQTDAIAYGLFTPYVKIQFFSRKQTCILSFDLGLKQFKVMNFKEEVISTVTMTDNLIIKSMALVFPDDEFINFILKQ